MQGHVCSGSVGTMVSRFVKEEVSVFPVVSSRLSTSSLAHLFGLSSQTGRDRTELVRMSKYRFEKSLRLKSNLKHSFLSFILSFSGGEPEYMVLNSGAWMHSSKQECCEANFSWMLYGCLGSSDPGAGATNQWYMVWDAPFKCKQDCVGTGPSCGGRANSWDQLFQTRSACCADKAAWNPEGCLVD